MDPSVPRVSASLWVGDLPIDLPNPEDALFAMFNKVGMVMSIKLCRDINTQRSMGYAYVNFNAPADADRALEQLNCTEIVPGRHIRIMWSNRDPGTRKSTEGNLFIKNLDKAITTKQLRDLFSPFGTILSVKISKDVNGASNGYGFVDFGKEESAKKAMALNGTVIGTGNQTIVVAPFVKKVERQAESDKTFTNIYLKNIRLDVDQDTLSAQLKAIGELSSVFLSPHSQHQTKFVLAVFANHEGALAAIEKLHDAIVPALTDSTTKLYVARALKKAERSKAGPSSQNLYQSAGRNLYVKHLEDMTQQQFDELFTPFGKVTSAVLAKDASGATRGFGFVCFETKESATTAIREMNGKVVSRIPLYVSLAQQKDARLQVLAEHRKGQVVLQQRLAMQMNQYPFRGAMGFPPMPFMMNPQNGGAFGMQQGGGRGMGPAGRGGLMMQPNQLHQGQIRGPQGPGNFGGVGFPQRGGIAPRMQMGSGPMHMMPPTQQQQQMRYTQPPPPQQRTTGITTNQLAKMTPEEQKNTLGEQLYARINEVHPQQAAKITGMLLEMDTPEILNVLDDQRILQQKVSEALHVLHQHEAGH